MKTIDDKQFAEQLECTYKGRTYYVRDNGEVYRVSNHGNTISRWDEKWTFGRVDISTGYLLIGGERVHRIVCTAFHGEPVGVRNIVDHIDTNRQNNRPENLRWVSKLENTLNNPITRAKIELRCGSVEAFLENPSLLYGHESEDPNFKWMKTVTKEEAQKSLKRWQEWASKPLAERMPQGKGVGEWIYADDSSDVAFKPSSRPRYSGPYKTWEEHKAAIEESNMIWQEQQYGLKDSLTPGAKQLDWKTPTEFLLCPGENDDRTLQAYLSNLVRGKTFTRTKYGDGGAVLDCGYNEKDDALYVLTHRSEVEGMAVIKPWALCKITFQDGNFIHENQGSFFQEDGGQKYFTLAMGREWTDGDVFDDFC